MKVLLVSSSSGSRGGGELYLQNLAHGLMQREAAVTLLFSDHAQMDELAESCQTGGIQVERFPHLNTYHRKLRSVSAALDSRRIKQYAALMSRHQPDVVHVNQQNVEDGLDLVYAASRCGIACVTTVHQPFSMARLKAIAGRLRDSMSRRAFRVTGIATIGVSRISTQNLADFLGRATTHASPAKMVYHVPNGVPCPSLMDRQQIRSQWGIGDDRFVLGCVGRIEKEKNPLFMCRLLKALPEHVHCVWIGDGRLRAALEDQVRADNLNHRFHFDGWQTAAAERLGGFDAFALPSLYEGLPLALLEAMSAGLPCFVSDIDGTRDAFRDHTSGRFCPVDDVAAWADAITAVIESDQQRQSLGRAAQQRYQSQFSLTAMAGATMDVYSDVIAHHRNDNA